MSRVCIHCEKEKTEEEFPVRKNKHYPKSICLACRRAKWFEWREAKGGTKKITGKICSMCKEEKPVSEFSKRKSSLDGYWSNCKTCEVARRKLKAGSKEVTAKPCTICGVVKSASEFTKKSDTADGLNHSCKACRRSYVLRSKYGISQSDYELMFYAQDGKCAICEKPSVKPLAVDHHHGTGKIRGLLCEHCNKGIGHFFENTRLMLSAISYIDKHRDNRELSALKTELGRLARK